MYQRKTALCLSKRKQDLVLIAMIIGAVCDCSCIYHSAIGNNLRLPPYSIDHIWLAHVSTGQNNNGDEASLGWTRMCISTSLILITVLKLAIENWHRLITILNGCEQLANLCVTKLWWSLIIPPACPS